MVGVEVGGGSLHTWGPLYFYILAVPFALSRDPSVAVTTLGAITLASVWLIYRLGSAFFGAQAGIMSAALFATYPRVVIVEKSLSNVTPVPFFTLIFFQCLFILLVSQRSVMIIPVLATLAVLVQLHLASLSLAIVLGLALAIFRVRLRLAHLLLGLASALLITLPYLITQGFSGSENVRTLLSFSRNELEFRNLWELCRIADGVLRTFPDLMMNSLHGVEYAWRFGLALFLTRLETWLILAGIVFACGTALVQAMRRGECRPSRTAYILVALWLVVPIITLGQKAFVVAHHFELLYPGAFLATGALLSTLLDKLADIARPQHAAYARAAVYALLASILASQVDFDQQLRRAVRAQGAVVWDVGEPAGAIELMPIRYKDRLVRALVQDFGLDREGFFHRVHGSRFLDLLDDKGYFFASMDTASGTARRSNTFHYAVDRGTPIAASIAGQRTVAVGPYTIREYVPVIDYAAWRCVHDPAPASGPGPALGTDGWWGIQLPTARIPDPAVYGPSPLRTWQSLPVYCRGTITREPPGPSRLRLIVSLRSSLPAVHQVGAFSLNDREIAARRTVRHGTLGAHSQDVLFDLVDLRPGPNDIAFRIDGRGLQFDLDVYENGG